MNLIYNEFLSKYIKQEVDLTNEEVVYKIALFTDAYSPSVDDSNYNDLHQAGYEVSGLGYIAGGSRITFGEPVVEDNRVNFTGSKVVWLAATFTARYAIIYREDDALLISCYDFGINQTVTLGTFTLNWKNVYTLSISLNGSDDAGYTHVDDKLSKTSHNPVSNKAITELFARLGLLIGGEKAPESAAVIADEIDTLNRIEEPEIDRIFGMVRHVPIHYMDYRWDEEKQQEDWVEIGFVCAFLDMDVRLALYEELTPEPKPGYTLNGWYFCPEFDERHFCGMPGDMHVFRLVETDVYLFPNWVENTYDVDFKALGVVEDPPSFHVTYGTEVELPMLDSLYYGLVDWYYDQDLEHFAGNPGDRLTITENTVLYANWVEKRCNVICYVDGGIYNLEEVGIGEFATKPVDPVKEGYTFYAWFSDPEYREEFTFLSRIYMNTYLYAKFEEN